MSKACLEHIVHIKNKENNRQILIMRWATCSKNLYKEGSSNPSKPWDCDRLTPSETESWVQSFLVEDRWRWWR